MLDLNIIAYITACSITSALICAKYFYFKSKSLTQKLNILSDDVALNKLVNSLAAVIRNEHDMQKALECVITSIISILSVDSIIILEESDIDFLPIVEVYANNKLQDFLSKQINRELIDNSFAKHQDIEIFNDKMGDIEYVASIIIPLHRTNPKVAIVIHSISEAEILISDLTNYQNKLLYNLGHLVELAVDMHKQRIINDIIEQKKESERRSVELAIKLEQQIKYQELQNDFISMASHEFRTPLAVIGSSTYIINRYLKSIFQEWQQLINLSADKEEENPEHAEKAEKYTTGYAKATELIATINSYVSQLSAMLESTLKMAIMDEQGIRNSKQELDLNVIMDETIKKLENLRNDVKISYINNSEKPQVFADLDNLKHVLTNLVSNAIKYSRPNTTVNVTIYEEASHVFISIEDQGIGIPKEQQENLFNKFFRGKNTTGITGIGIGLYITKKLLDLNDGHISVHSTEGVGSKFLVKFRGVA